MAAAGGEGCKPPGGEDDDDDDVEANAKQQELDEMEDVEEAFLHLRSILMQEKEWLNDRPSRTMLIDAKNGFNDLMLLAMLWMVWH